MGVAIINYNGGADLTRCLESLLLQDLDGCLDLVVLDNGSTDGSPEAAERRFPGSVRVVRSPANLGFAGGGNLGASQLRGQHLLFLNPDVVLEPGCVQALADALDRSPGVAGPLLRYDDGRLEAGMTVDLVGDSLDARPGTPPLYLSGCALATNRGLFEGLGGFDGRMFMIAEDLDYCWRALLAGYEVRTVEGAVAHHRGGGGTPGGYVRGGTLEVTAFRIALRERNLIAAYLTCASPGWLLVALAGRLARITAIMGVALASGRLDLVRHLASGIAWNVRQLPETLRRRSACRPRGTTRAAVLGSRAERRVVAFGLLRRYGLPEFVDRPTAAAAAD